MEIFLVGGAVRDEVLGVPVKDRDWVVVGATPEKMIELGFQQVGADFPVFMHPKTKEEHALACTARSARVSHPSVTLEEDLARRDLTMNAIAKEKDGGFIDPHGGIADARRGIFRHVGDSFEDDPIRILRVARLAARHPTFTVAPQTRDLMARMVQRGDVDSLVPERVWKEMSRGLQEDKPSRMIQVLRECGALARILPELDRLYGVPAPAQWHPEIDTGVHVEMAIDHAAKRQTTLGVRFATLVHDLGKGLTDPQVLPHHPAHEVRGVALVDAVCKRWKVPNELQELAYLVTKEHGNVHACLGLRPSPMLRLLERCGAVKHQKRFEDILLACECDARGRLGLENRDYAQPDFLRGNLAAALSIDMKAIVARTVARGIKGKAIGEIVLQERFKAIKAHQAPLKSTNGPARSAAPR